MGGRVIKNATATSEAMPLQAPSPETIFARFDPLIKNAFESLGNGRKRTPLVHEVAKRLTSEGHALAEPIIERSLIRQGLPAVTPHRLRKEFDLCRASLGLGIGDRITAWRFSRFLKESYNITLRRGFLNTWEVWGNGVSKPPFCAKVRGADRKATVKSAIENEYEKFVQHLRESDIRSRLPLAREIYLKVRPRFGEFTLGPSGFGRLVAELNKERTERGEEKLRFHQSRVRLTDTIERLHWTQVKEHGRSPTYHEIANKLSEKWNRPVNWEVVRSAYRRINAYRIAECPPLKTQKTLSVYDIEIVKAHERLHKPHRPPTIREVMEELKAARPDTQCTPGQIQHRIEKLRKRGHDLPLRMFEITPEIVRGAYEKVRRALETSPSLEEIRSVVLKANPEVTEISKSAISLHLRELRAQHSKSENSADGRYSHRFEVRRVPGLNRLQILRELSVFHAHVFEPRLVALTDRYELPEKRKATSPVLYIPQTPANRAFLRRIVGDVGHAHDTEQVSLWGNAFLKAKKIWGDGYARSATITPVTEKLLLGVSNEAPLTQQEWRGLIEFAINVIIPQMGLISARRAEMVVLFPKRFLADTRNARDVREILRPALKYHRKSTPRDEGKFSRFQLIDMALLRAFHAHWKLL